MKPDGIRAVGNCLLGAGLCAIALVMALRLLNEGVSERRGGPGGEDGAASSEEIHDAASLEMAQIGVSALLGHDKVKIEVASEEPRVVTVHFENSDEEPITAETVKAVRRRVRAMLKLPKETPVRLVDFGGTAQGDDVLEETAEEVVHYRHIYFKLPLEGVRFHWRFRDRPQFLAGTLTLVVSRGDQKQTIKVFSNGAISEGWQPIDCDCHGRGNGIYFGFVSTVRYPVTLGDVVEIVLDCPSDLDGIGPDSTGILVAGQHRSRSPFKLHFFPWEEDEPQAFLSEWDEKWPLRTTGNKGWMDERKAQQGGSAP